MWVMDFSLNNKKQIIELILLLVIGMITGVGLSMGWRVKESNQKEENLVEIYFYLSEKPLLNKEVRLVTTVIPKKDIGTGSVKLTLSEGFTVVEAESLTWEGDIKKDEFIQIPAKIKVAKAGRWQLIAEVKTKEVLKKTNLVIEATEEDVNISSEKAEYILNPLPPDKFVFVEVHTYCEDKTLEGDPWKNGPYYNKNKKKYVEWPQIKPCFDHISIYGTYFIVHEGSEFEEALIIMNTFFHGRSIGPGEFASGGGSSSHRVIESLPFLIANFGKKRIEKGEFVLSPKDIFFTKVNKDGILKIKYGEEEIILKPGNSWDTIEEIVEEFRNEKGDKLRAKFTTMVTIKNRGIIEKVYPDESSY